MKCIFIVCLILMAVSAEAASPNPFFAMDTIARGEPEVVAPMLKELGYDGLGGQAGDDRMATELEGAGLRLFNGYLTLSFDGARPALDDRMRAILDRMQRHDSALWLAVQKVETNGVATARTSPDGSDIAVAKLREIADYAKARGVRIALYPHTGMWIERVEEALRVADKLNRPDVGVTFNLCHWLKVEGADRDPLPVLKAAQPRLMFVTINGADAGDTRSMGWDRLIQPLGSGSYDVAAFLRKLREADYTGPIGFQGYGISQEPKEVLRKTIAAWRAMQVAP